MYRIKKKIINNDRPKKYGFVTQIIKMLLEIKLRTSTSFRAIALNAAIISETLRFETKSPTHTTILNWVHKLGYYQLKIKKEKSEDWIIIIDESIQIGKEKILMVFGIREKDIDFTRALVLQDILPLKEKVSVSWTGEEISKVLFELKKELGKIKYAVCDGNRNIKKALRIAKIEHIYDITHKIAMILEKRYNSNEKYIELLEKIAVMKKNYIQTDIAFLMPPKMRTKSRYLNIIEISKWLYKTLKYYEINKNKNNRICEKFKWLYNYKDFIIELYQSIEDIKSIEKGLKTNGFSKETEKYCNDILNKNKSCLGKTLKKELVEYFQELSNKVPKTKKLLITSDIIESSFGKYKNYLSENPMAGITNLILCIAAFTFKLNERNIKKALESTAIDDIKQWTNETIGKSLFQMRKQAYALS